MVLEEKDLPVLFCYLVPLLPDLLPQLAGDLSSYSSSTSVSQRAALRSSLMDRPLLLPEVISGGGLSSTVLDGNSGSIMVKSESETDQETIIFGATAHTFLVAVV